MRKQSKSVSGQRGAAAIELALSLVFLVPLMLGTFAFGFKLVRSIEMIQITRDLAHMYLRGIDFRNAGPLQNAQTLAAEYALTSTGTSQVVMSQIRLATQADCDAANPAHKGLTCANRDKPVFMQQVTIGNTSVGSSAFGTPPLQSDDTPTVANLAANTTVQANGFGTIITLTPNQVAYVAEMINRTTEFNIPGLSGQPQVYARTIF